MAVGSGSDNLISTWHFFGFLFLDMCFHGSMDWFFADFAMAAGCKSANRCSD
jgi:hypothetical protein